MEGWQKVIQSRWEIKGWSVENIQYEKYLGLTDNENSEIAKLDLMKYVPGLYCF